MTYCKTVWLVDNDGTGNCMTEKLMLLSSFAGKVLSLSLVDEALLLLSKEAESNEVLLPDFIFINVNIPDKKAWDFLRIYLLIPAEKRARCGLYLLSSSADADAILMASQYQEVCGFLSKPLLMHDLEKIMQSSRFMDPSYNKSLRG